MRTAAVGPGASYYARANTSSRTGYQRAYAIARFIHTPRQPSAFPMAASHVEIKLRKARIVVAEDIYDCRAIGRNLSTPGILRRAPGGAFVRVVI